MHENWNKASTFPHLTGCKMQKFNTFDIRIVENCDNVADIWTIGIVEREAIYHISPIL